MPAAIAFPTWIRPEIIPGLPIRWYGLMYVVAFAVAWLLFTYESKRRRAPWTAEDAEMFFFWAIVGLIVGARLFGTLLYDPSGYYHRKPWLIFWPFDEGTTHFAGFQGMSYHGGLVGVIVATLVYCGVKKSNWLAWADVIAVSAPLGYTFGRLGNFINGELWGKVTSSPIGMIFPNVPESGRFKASEAWVQEAATKAGIRLSSMNDLVNLPRHPSQLYEACFEGLLLWLVLWLFVRKRKAFHGFATGLYIIGYGAVRFVIEYFREPDEGIGYILGDRSAPRYVVTSVLNLSTGQILCAIMVAVGVLVLAIAPRIGPRIAPRIEGKPSAGTGDAPAKAAAQQRPAGQGSRSSASKEARKLRKKLK